MKSPTAAGSRVDSNGAASTSSAAQVQKGKKQVVIPSTLRTDRQDARFQDPVGRESPRVAQVALDPAATPLVDLNAATFAGGDPNRIRLADLILNDGETSPCPSLMHLLFRCIAQSPRNDNSHLADTIVLLIL